MVDLGITQKKHCIIRWLLIAGLLYGVYEGLAGMLTTVMIFLALVGLDLIVLLMEDARKEWKQ